MTDCRIYVACLASYNNGSLHGAWIDCDGKDSDDIRTEVSAMLRASPYPNVTVEHEGKDVPSAEEWAIHDHEGFNGLIGEYTSFDDVAQIAEALSGDDAIGFAYLVDHLNMDVSDAIDQADDVTIHQSDAMDLAKDYAESLVDDCYSQEIESLPDLIKYNIDYEGIAHDLKQGGDICEFTHDGETVLITNANSF